MPFTPLVSIIIPVYNGADYLHEAIESALSQTYKNIEVLVVNDGSNDGGQTEAIAGSYGDRIRYLSKPNGGVASALNAGIQTMQGEYFSWLSHDDVYYPEKIAQQIKLLVMNNDPDQVVFSECDFIDERSQVKASSRIQPAYLKNQYLTILSTSIGGCSLLIPKKCFKQAGLFNEDLKTTQDNEMWLRIAKAGFQFTYLPAPLLQSRIHAQMGSKTLKPRHRKEKDSFYLWAIKYLGQDLAPLQEDFIRIMLNKRCFSVITALLFHRNHSIHISSSLILKAGLSYCFNRAVQIIAHSRAITSLRSLQVSIFRSEQYWEHRYASGGDAGAGSHGILAQYKAEIINTFVTKNNIQTVIDFGCGEGTQLALYHIPHYTGVDVSDTAIERCIKRFQDDPSKKFYTQTPFSTISTLPQADLTLSIDVLYHLVEDTIFYQYIHNLFALSKRYVIIYSTNFDASHTSPHQLDRKFTTVISREVPDFELLEVISNPFKGPMTMSDFYIYNKKSCSNN